MSEKEAQGSVFLGVCTNKSRLCVQEMYALLEATGGWMIDGVGVFLVYLCTYMCVSLLVYVYACVRT